jgi:hypothetical protein
LLAREPLPRFEPMEMGVNEVKLKHDCEQLAYLLEIGQLPPAYAPVLADYRALFGEIRGKVDENTLVPFDHGSHPLVARTYKRPFHLAEVAPPARIINPELDFEAIQDRYLAADPNVMALDNLLTPEALQAVRRFCRESTIWNNIKGGYLGAYFFDGFCSELLLRLAWELRRHLPRVIADHPLNMMWGYKCDCTLPGLAVHADAAAVNVNFWITEDEANLDPDGGGLRVYEHDAPGDWDFRAFNKEAGKIQDYLESIGSVPTRYPYRANRALIFDSDLFHATDAPRFREGYLNRRINITCCTATGWDDAEMAHRTGSRPPTAPRCWNARRPARMQGDFERRPARPARNPARGAGRTAGDGDDGGGLGRPGPVRRRFAVGPAGPGRRS